MIAQSDASRRVLLQVIAVIGLMLEQMRRLETRFGMLLLL